MRDVDMLLISVRLVTMRSIRELITVLYVEVRHVSMAIDMAHVAMRITMRVEIPVLVRTIGVDIRSSDRIGMPRTVRIPIRPIRRRPTVIMPISCSAITVI